MSTDVYFDFYSQELWPVYWAYITADNSVGPYGRDPGRAPREAFSSKRKELEERDGKHSNYDICRVGYLSNFVAHCNWALWRGFERKWRRKVVTTENIRDILADWFVIYTNSQKPENAEDCFMIDDIADTAEIEEALVAHVGFHLDIRVD